MLLTCYLHVVDVLLFAYFMQNLSNEEQVVVIHARTVLTLAEKVKDTLERHSLPVDRSPLL